MNANGAARFAPEEAAHWKRIATYAAVGVAVALIAIKAGAWAMTSSVAMLASLFDSSLDLVASGLNLLAVRHALTPADAEHRFGHGKAEAIAGLGQAAVITGSMTFLVIESVSRLIQPVAIEQSAVGIAVMLVSLALTIGLVWLQNYVIRRTASVAISADSLHYVGDIAMNGVVIAALLLAGPLGWIWMDAVGGLVVAAIIAYGAWQILSIAYNQLMDREFDNAERDRIKDIVLANPKVRSMHDLRTRKAGGDAFIQFHIELDPEISLVRAHDISDEVEIAVRNAFPEADVIIHQDPEGAEENSALAST